MGTEHGLLKLLFLKLRCFILNEIGESLRDARESHGVSIEEAAEDLGIKPSQLKSLEDGDIKKFKDVLNVKDFIKNYAKYLGMDGDKLIDEFNEYLFDYTSRIPIDKIKEAQETVTKEEKKIVSPYTEPVKKNKFLSIKILYALIIILLFVAGFLIVNGINNNEETSPLSYYYVER